jgi:hypothetical protein
MIDLILHAADRSTISTFAQTTPPANPLLVQDAEGNWVTRPGVEWSWWSGAGKLMVAKRTERAPQAVTQVADPEFGFAVGGSPPEWAKSGLYVVDDNGDTIGTFDRIQGTVAVFTLASGATLPSVSDNLTPVSPPEFLAGQTLLLRLHSEFFENDRIIPDDADPDKEEQWARSKVVKYVKDNGTGPTNFDLAGTNVPYYELDGVKFTKATTLISALKAAGIPHHEFLGGNRY